MGVEKVDDFYTSKTCFRCDSYKFPALVSKNRTNKKIDF